MDNENFIVNIKEFWRKGKFSESIEIMKNMLNSLSAEESLERTLVHNRLAYAQIVGGILKMLQI